MARTAVGHLLEVAGDEGVEVSEGGRGVALQGAGLHLLPVVVDVTLGLIEDAVAAQVVPACNRASMSNDERMDERANECAAGYRPRNRGNHS